MAATRNSEMESIRQTGTISDYCNVFQDWFERVQIIEGFSDFYGVYLFICGLESEVRDIFVDWHQYSCNRVDDVISLALKIDANGLRDSFSPFDPTSSFYKQELEFNYRISLDEIMKDNEFFKKGRIFEVGKDLVTEISQEDVNVQQLFDGINSKGFEKDEKTMDSARKVFDKMPMNIILKQDLIGNLGNNIGLLGIGKCSKNGFEVFERIGYLTNSLGPSKFVWKWHDIWKWPNRKKKGISVILGAAMVTPVDNALTQEKGNIVKELLDKDRVWDVGDNRVLRLRQYGNFEIIVCWKKTQELVYLLHVGAVAGNSNDPTLDKTADGVDSFFDRVMVVVKQTDKENIRMGRLSASNGKHDDLALKFSLVGYLHFLSSALTMLAVPFPSLNATLARGMLDELGISISEATWKFVEEHDAAIPSFSIYH